MEKLFTPLPKNTATSTTNASIPKMGCSQNSSQLIPSFYGPLSYYPSAASSSNSFPLPLQQPCQSLQFSHICALECPVCPFWFGQNEIGIHSRQCLLQPNMMLVSMEQKRKVFDAYKTKVARNRRKLARKKSLSNRHPSSAGTNPTTLVVEARRLPLNTDGSGNRVINRDLYKFFTPDNKRLRVLLRKELKTSDVGSLGRIVLPKREVEENLPIQFDKEGIRVMIRDAYSNQEWNLKFKYWTNNKSRMYVLENTGEFVKQNGLEIGDFLTLYEDESMNLYFSIKKAERPATVEPLQIQHITNRNQKYIDIPHMYQAKDEEEASIALLIEQLSHKEQQEEANSLVTLDTTLYRLDNINSISTYLQPPAAAALSSSSSQSKMIMVDDQRVEDCYNSLDVLPDFSRYNFPLYDP